MIGLGVSVQPQRGSTIADFGRTIEQAVEDAERTYYRLVIVVGPPASGKTRALSALHNKQGWPILNLNLALSESLLDLTVKQRALRVASAVVGLSNEQSAASLLIDNIEMLFHPDLQQDPLRLFQSLARNRVVVVSWPGAYLERALTYAEPGHPEYRRYADPEALIIATTGHHPDNESTVQQENLA